MMLPSVHSLQHLVSPPLESRSKADTQSRGSHKNSQIHNSFMYTQNQAEQFSSQRSINRMSSVNDSNQSRYLPQFSMQVLQLKKVDIFISYSE